MRADMDKIAFERGRVGYGRPPRLGKKDQIFSSEDYEKSQKMSANKTSRYTCINNIPLDRWLHKQVGRPYSEVYSEFRRKINVNSYPGKKLLDIFKSTIHTDIEMHDGIPYFKGRRVFYVDYGFYVDNETGLLQFKDRKKLKREYRPNYIKVGSTQIIKKIKDIYYMITFLGKDSLGGHEVMWNPITKDYQVFTKRQLNKREIHTYNVKDLSPTIGDYPFPTRESPRLRKDTK